MSDLSGGYFITLEGGEGTGKSTLAKGLANRLKAEGFDVVITREPGGTPLAEEARRLLLHPPEGLNWSPLSEALLANTARSDHLENLIRPALAEGKWVICDRFADSTRVYQSIEGGVSAETLQALEKIVVAGSEPDRTLILDAPLSVAADRRAARAGVLDSFERRGDAFHEAVRQAFLVIARTEPQRCRLIDASLSETRVLEEAWANLADLIRSGARAGK